MEPRLTFHSKLSTRDNCVLHVHPAVHHHRKFTPTLYQSGTDAQISSILTKQSTLGGHSLDWHLGHRITTHINLDDVTRLDSVKVDQLHVGLAGPSAPTSTRIGRDIG